MGANPFGACLMTGAMLAMLIPSTGSSKLRWTGAATAAVLLVTIGTQLVRADRPVVAHVEYAGVIARLEQIADPVEPLSLGWVDLGEVVGHVVDELSPRARGHAFDVRIAPNLPRVQTDVGKLHQILSNLVENALKYAPPDTRVTISADPGVRGVAVVVADEGPGIPDEAHERIFDRFYQVDQSATRRVGGTGLGLYICRRMAETLGARLWLARSDGSGSEFALFVPDHAPAVRPADEEAVSR
jgi:signal transduction histidine kinase